MNTTILEHQITATRSPNALQIIYSSLMRWCIGQEHNRLLWLAIALGIHGCVLAPIAIMLIVATGVSMTLLFITTLGMSLTLVSNLAALPTKYTIPVFLITAMLDVIIIVACLVNYLS